MGCRAPRGAREGAVRCRVPKGLLQRVPAILDFLRHGRGVFAAGEVDHAGPEGARAHTTWHQVGTVKAEGGRVHQNVCLTTQRVVQIGVWVHAFVWCQEAGLCREDFVCHWQLEEFHQRGLWRQMDR